MATLGERATGSTVKLNMSGTATEFLVVHQGLPSSDYDNSCNGTWLFCTTNMGSRTWDATDNDYENSDIHAWLNDTILTQFDTGIQKTIKKVKIPYWKGTSSSGQQATGANGLQCKLFLLSVREMYGGTFGSYFGGTQLKAFVDNYETYKTKYFTWSRTPNYTAMVAYLDTSFNWKQGKVATDKKHTRFAMIMPDKCEVDSSGFVLPHTAMNGDVNIGGTWKELSASHVNVGGVWKEVSEGYENIGGVWQPIS